MDIKHVEKGGLGAFLIRNEEGKRIAEMTYAASGDSAITIDHTEADPEIRNQGVGTKLLAEAVEHARKHNLKIRATCPFALKKLKEDPKYADVFEDN